MHSDNVTTAAGEATAKFHQKISDDDAAAAGAAAAAAAANGSGEEEVTSTAKDGEQGDQSGNGGSDDNNNHGDNSNSAEAAAQAMAASAAAEAKAAAEARVAAAAKLRFHERERWAKATGILRMESRPQRLDRHDFAYFISNRNAERYPCVVVKLPKTDDGAEGGDDDDVDDDDDDKKKQNKKSNKKKKKKKKAAVDKHPTLYEVLYYDSTKENPLELGWEAIARDSFVPPTDIRFPVWDADLERELDAQRAAAATAIQRIRRGTVALARHQMTKGAVAVLQRFMRARVQTWVQRRRAEEFARKPVAYRLLVMDEQLESLLELKTRAVTVENFDEAHALKLQVQQKRHEKERYVAERDGYLERIRALATANDALTRRKREAVGLEDYLFAKEIKLEMERNAEELAACLRQTNLTHDYVQQMRDLSLIHI